MRKIQQTMCTFLMGICLAGMVSCVEYDQIKEDLSSLDSRIEALESKIPLLNEQVAAIAKLSQATTVNKVSFKDNVYTITLSDGSVLTLSVGDAGVGNIPIISLDKEGFWMVDYQDGNGPFYLKDGEIKLPSKGEDASLPVLSIDKEGFWMINYGNGAEYLLDKNGKKVKAATADGAIDPFFEDVNYDPAAGQLNITLKGNGETMQLPVIPDFLLALKNAEGLQIFEYGQTKVYPIESRGVKESIIQTPAGWSAILEQEAMTVTAPEAPLTKAGELADSDKDIVIISQAISGSYVSVSKLKVMLSGAEINIKPHVSVTPGNATENSLTFKIKMKDATSYKYMLVKKRTGTKTYEEVKNGGQEESASELLIDGLSPETEYLLQIIACNGDILSEEMCSISIRTGRPTFNSYYEAYNNGNQIEIGGTVIDKATFGEATLLTAEHPVINQDGVIFVPSDVIAQHAPGSSVRGTLIIVGDNPSQQSKMEFVKTAGRIEFDAKKKGSFIMKNMDFRGNTTNDPQVLYKINNTGNMKTIAFENCSFNLNRFQGLTFADGKSATDAIGIGTFSFENCNINLGTEKRLAYFIQYRKFVNVNEFVFKNNIVWGGTQCTARLYNGVVGSDYKNGSWIENICFEQNTWVNIHPLNLFFIKGSKYITAELNLLHAPITSYTPILFNSEDGDPVDGVISRNLGFVNGPAKVIWKATNPNTIPISVFKQIENCPIDPFKNGGTFDDVNGIFIPASDYDSFGARR